MAEHIAAAGQARNAPDGPIGAQLEQALGQIEQTLRVGSSLNVRAIKDEAAPFWGTVKTFFSNRILLLASLGSGATQFVTYGLGNFAVLFLMREKGMTEEAIAAAFFVDVKVVKQRLRLVTVAPELLEVYAEDGMTLEQLMAFTISGDHARQAQVWDAVKNSWSKEPYQIRRMLTETAVRASDKRARFLGLNAYEAAGGFVLRDLFQQDDGGWLQDPVLLERLVGEKLKAEAEALNKAAKRKRPPPSPGAAVISSEQSP